MRAAASILALAVLLSAEKALAELPEAPSPVILPAIARDIDLDEHLGAAIDKRLRFTDSQGQGVTLGDSFHDGKPVNPLPLLLPLPHALRHSFSKDWSRVCAASIIGSATTIA